MTADRLREAAEVMDGWVVYAPPPGGDLGTPASEWVPHCAECRRYDAIAALLRAIANEHESFAESVGPAVMEDYDDASFDAALALASVVLGVTDE